MPTSPDAIGRAPRASRPRCRPRRQRSWSSSSGCSRRSPNPRSAPGAIGEKFAAELLPAKDSLEAAVESAARTDSRGLMEGQEATLRLLSQALERIGVRVIDPAGEPFDPERHEAVMAEESATAEPGSVLRVVQPGYELNGRLLRPARVIVAREPAPKA
ncbi:MAG: nucleotide exchange factor GrpE [Gammaproteobacteria bacterium]|nr:MAG: nucleotide exchange factor GrpE [Gammaproteobacteria bacterium]